MSQETFDQLANVLRTTHISTQDMHRIIYVDFYHLLRSGSEEVLISTILLMFEMLKVNADVFYYMFDLLVHYNAELAISLFVYVPEPSRVAVNHELQGMLGGLKPAHEGDLRASVLEWLQGGWRGVI